MATEILVECRICKEKVSLYDSIKELCMCLKCFGTGRNRIQKEISLQDHSLIEKIKEIFKETQDLFDFKTSVYGSPDTTLGAKGGFVFIWSKMKRLKTLLWDEDYKCSEEERVATIEDSLKDLVVHSAIILSIFRKEKDTK